MRKYEVGDKVILKTKEEILADTDSFIDEDGDIVTKFKSYSNCIIEDMMEFLGKEVTIDYVYDTKPAYEIEEECDDKFTWEECWIKSKV